MILSALNVSRNWIILLLVEAVLASYPDKEKERLLPVPKRELEWGDVNFIATSDTHGWLLGHQHATWPEPNYSGDYGDLASFVEHMREIASSKGSDLLLVDCGDHHDGSGLVSSSSAGASRADDIFNQLEYDIITIGNHELYNYAVAKTIYEQAKGMEGRYLTSNVNITVLSDEGKSVSVPIGARYRKFKTAQGRRVTAFGVIFDFQAHDHNLTIQSPALLSKEPWFLETISEAPDYFVLAGHQPVRGEGAEWAPIYKTIRAKHPFIPIFIFGGHTHVRDCTQYDDRSIAVVPGRYLETATFVSSNLPSDPNHQGPLKMNRRYIDSNRVSYQYHSKTNTSTFDTPLGQEITSNLHNLASALNISTPLGTAPQDLYLARYPYGHKRSLLTVWNNEVLPLTVVDKERKGKRIIIGNTGSMRFELFAGRFDRNDELTISPFKNGFKYIRLPVQFALSITPEMNRAGTTKFAPSPKASSLQSELGSKRLRYEDDLRVKREYDNWLAGQREEYEGSAEFIYGMEGNQVVLGDNGRRGKHGLTLGYVTRDACVGKGDDIEHIPLPHSMNQPDFSETPLGADSIPDLQEEIDVVVMDFAIDDFVTAVHTLQPGSNLTLGDFKVYAEGMGIDTLWGDYASLKW